MIIPLLVATASAADGQSTEVDARIASNRDGDTIEVRPLDDPDNPYAGQYGAWDLWVWDNYIVNFNPGDFPIKREPGQTTYTYGDDLTYTNSNGQPMPEGWGYDSLVIDEDGFAVPKVAGYASRLGEVYSAGWTLREAITDKPAGVAYNEQFFLYGAGIKPVGLDDELQHACDLQRARQYPMIPGWLGENLPLKVVFSPNGDIICYGELGLHYQDIGIDKHQLEYYICPETWYRYSPTGELLAQYTRPTDSSGMMADNNWTATYSQDLPERINQALRELIEAGTPPTTTYHYYGYVAMILLDDPNARYAMTSRDMSDAEIPFAWDYLGNEIDPDTVLDLPNTNYGMAQDRERLETAYAAQVELGLTDPTAGSPFAGLENGPRTVDPVPRRPRFKARPRRGSRDAVEVKGMDALENPYRGHYDEWDVWLLDQIGKRNPLEDAYDQEQFRENQARIEAKLRAGEEITTWDHGYTPYEPGPDDPWKKIEINVDDHGCIIPARLYAEMLIASRTEPWDIRETISRPLPAQHIITSGGVMPAEMLAGYTAACEVPVDLGLPVVPAWLAAAPVHRVVFVPNGEIVTLGPPGHRTKETENWAYRAEYWVDEERAWYRFDAEGNLLDTYVTNGNDWQVLYNPRYNALKSNALDTGMEVTEPAGYMVITDPVIGECKAVFDYDGTPVDPNSLVSRPYGFGRGLYWRDLQEFPVADSGEQMEE